MLFTDKYADKIYDTMDYCGEYSRALGVPGNIRYSAGTDATSIAGMEVRSAPIIISH